MYIIIYVKDKKKIFIYFDSDFYFYFFFHYASYKINPESYLKTSFKHNIYYIFILLTFEIEKKK